MKKSKKEKFKVLIVAAETSSSLYAQRLLEKWKSEKLDFEAFGIGNRSMEKLGFRCLGYAEDLAVVGLVEVVKHFKPIYKVFHSLVDEAKKEKPDLILLLDYPDFNFRLAKKLKSLNFPIYYYISPQIWAWRSGRVKFIKKYIDKMLVLFPFEVDFYKQYGVDVDFVGHPLLDELKPEFFDKEALKLKKQKLGIGPEQKTLALMPGSRNSELDHHLDIQIQTAEELLSKHENLSVLLLVAPNLDIEEFRARVKTWNIPIQLIQADPFEMVSIADVVLCASGTATLTVALMEKPMAIMYRMKPLTVFIAQFIMKFPEYFGMVNLISKKKVSAEFFQSDANPKKISAYLSDLLSDQSIYNEQVNDLKNVKNLLGSQGATNRVSDIILNSIYED